MDGKQVGRIANFGPKTLGVSNAVDPSREVPAVIAVSISASRGERNLGQGQ